MDNPFAALEQSVRRQVFEEQALAALGVARTQLILGQATPNEAAGVFFATLACRFSGCHSKVDWTEQTACVDGTDLYYNPEFIAGLTGPETIGVLVHEVLHVAMLHHVRLGDGWDLETANDAGDLAVNGPIREAGFTLPHGAYFPGEGTFADLPAGQSFETYYHALMERKANSGTGTPVDGDQPGDKPGTDPGKSGTFSRPTNPDAPGVVDPATTKAQECDWNVAVAEASALARQRGELPGGIGTIVDETFAPKVSPWDVLREFLSAKAKADYSWSRPNRRLLSQGLYLPTLSSETLGDVVFMVDHSGSIDQAHMDVFCAHASAILSLYDCELKVIFHTHEVTAVQTWTPADGELHLELPKESGGTSHVPPFEWIESEGWTPTCVVAFTDLETLFPPEPPYPTLWATLGATAAPWGQVVEVSA